MAKLFASGQNACYLYSLAWICNGGILSLQWSMHLKADKRKSVDFMRLLSICFSIHVFLSEYNSES